MRDLVAHVLMWDEINLAVLTEARQGRPHWSLASRWEDPRAGTLLNRSGVAAGRELPVGLPVHRFMSTRDALLDEFSRYDDEDWSDPVELTEYAATSIGGLAEYVMTVPGNPAFWHAAVHLGELTTVGT